MTLDTLDVYGSAYPPAQTLLCTAAPAVGTWWASVTTWNTFRLMKWAKTVIPRLYTGLWLPGN